MRQLMPHDWLKSRKTKLLFLSRQQYFIPDLCWQCLDHFLQPVLVQAEESEIDQESLTPRPRIVLQDEQTFDYLDHSKPISDDAVVRCV